MQGEASVALPSELKLYHILYNAALLERFADDPRAALAEFAAAGTVSERDRAILSGLDYAALRFEHGARLREVRIQLQPVFRRSFAHLAAGAEPLLGTLLREFAASAECHQGAPRSIAGRFLRFVRNAPCCLDRGEPYLRELLALEHDLVLFFTRAGRPAAAGPKSLGCGGMLVRSPGAVRFRLDSNADDVIRTPKAALIHDPHAVVAVLRPPGYTMLRLSPLENRCLGFADGARGDEELFWMSGDSLGAAAAIERLVAAGALERGR